MTAKSILLLLASASTAAASAAIVRYTLKDRFAWKGCISQLICDIFGLLTNLVFLAGLAVFVLANVLWLLVLSSQKLSVAYSVQIGLVMVFNAVISAFFFSEQLTTHGYFGLVLVIAGVTLIVR